VADSKKIHIPTGLAYNREFLAMLQQFADRISAIGETDDLSQTISNPPTQAQVQAISDKIDELLEAARGL
jgi:hypothetical protein